MRNNQPVSRCEYPLKAGTAIISHTDAKGRITHCNDEFVEASGFTREELIAQPHNLVRHPDMPTEAFRDLWETLKKGFAWQGIVKNRRKNGDHYWVKATATPLPDGGYMSVRSVPARAEVQAAEALYREMQGNTAIRLAGGKVFRGGVGLAARWRARFSVLPLFWKFALPLLVGSVALGIALWLSMSALKRNLLEDAGHARAVTLINASQNARIFYATEILPKAVEQGLSIGHEFRQDATTLPLPASFMKALGDMAGQSGAVGKLRLASRYPFSFRTGAEAQLDEFEKAALDFLEKSPKETFGSLVEKDGHPVYRLAVADVMTATSCVNCHNNHPASIKRDWKQGDVRGLIAAEVDMTELASHMKDTLFVTGAILAMAMLAGIALIAVIARRQSVRLNHVSSIAADIARGDLTGELPQVGEDEIGRLANQVVIMRNKLLEITHTLVQSTRQLDDATHELASAATQTAMTVEAQADATTGVAAAVEEFSVSIDQVEGHANEAHSAAATSDQAATGGSAIAHRIAEEIGRVARTVTDAAEGIRELEGISGEIGQIVVAIKDIADQTNLLALNAAIEAARAGEQGRGFAVVADEVRKLAERTAQSTTLISSMVERIQSLTRNAVRDMETGVSQVENGVKSAHQTGDSISGICEKSSRVLAAAEEIRHALKEQAGSAREISRKIEQIAQMSEENAAASRQTQEASGRVAALAQHLKKLAAQFKVG